MTIRDWLVSPRAQSVWGMLDLASFFWGFYLMLFSGSAALLAQVRDIVDSARGFGGGMAWMSVLSFLGLIGFFSLVVSGVFLVANKKIGGYFSVVHFPMRLLLLMPPTFFFVIPNKFVVDSVYIVVALLVIWLSESIRLYSHIKWLRS